MTRQKPNKNPDHGTFEMEPVRFDISEAWWFFNNKWIPLAAADAKHKLYVLTKQSYDEIFGELPPLPPEAFRVGPTDVKTDVKTIFLGHALFDPPDTLLSARTKPVKFAELNTFPVVWMLTGDAWCYAADTPGTDNLSAWRRVNTAEANIKAHLLDKAAFDERFPRLPPMPIEADNPQTETFRDALEFYWSLPVCYYENEPSPFPTYRRMFSPERNAEFEELRAEKLAMIKEHQDTKKLVNKSK